MTAILWHAREYAALRSIAAALKAKQAAMMDRWLNIRTVGSPDRYKHGMTPRFRDAVIYIPAGYGLIRKSLAHLALTHDDVIFDVGCGMGRVLCYVARRPVKRCIGIELSGELAAIATANASSLRSRKADIEIRQQDAAEADYSEGTVYWLYNPFGELTLQAVLSRIRESLEASPRQIRIVYARPVHGVRFTVSTLVDSRAAVALTVTSVHFGQLLAQPVTISCASLNLAQKL